MADQPMTTVAQGVASQRAKTSPQHQSVPGDALSVASGPSSKGSAGEVSGGTMTIAGLGLLTRAGRKGPPPAS